MTQKFVRIYNLSTEKAISDEFKRAEGKCYLDHAGATLYSEAQLEGVLRDMQINVYGNPHARNTASKICEDSVDQMRFRILEHFNTTSDKYSVIFTSGATAALHLVGECFDYKGGKFVYLQDNHTSVLGMRELAQDTKVISFKRAHETFKTYENVQCKTFVKLELEKNVPTHESLKKAEQSKHVLIPENLKSDHKSLSTHKSLKEGSEESENKCVSTCENLTEDGGELKSLNQKEQQQKNSLFVYPAQCNFSGYKYPLDWIDKVHTGALDDKPDTNWFCLLDAASFTATNSLDLSKYQPDFVCLSFYKLFGYPTGLGALLVSKRGEEVLKRKYYGGGTVYLAMSGKKHTVRRKILHERFEDGTLPFLSIISLQQGYETFKRLNLSMEMISMHTFNLAKYVYENLRKLHHSNGEPACILYHDTEFDSREVQGAIVNFNLLRADGTHIGYSEVMHISNLYEIYLRTGCFCNPGACQRHLGLSDDDVKHHYEMGHVCGDQNDLIEGIPTGSVRISFGYMSTIQDANEFIDMVVNCFVTPPVIRKSRNLKLTFDMKDAKYVKSLVNGIENVTSAASINNNNEEIASFEEFTVKASKQTNGLINEEVRKIFSQEFNQTSSGSIKISKKQINKVTYDSYNEISKQNKVFNIDQINPSSETNTIFAGTFNGNCDNTDISGTIKSIFLYPIKSCGAFSPCAEWNLCRTGLKYDREWMIVDRAGVCLTQKNKAEMCLIRPVIDLNAQEMILTCEGFPNISVPLPIKFSGNTKKVNPCKSKVCRDQISGWDCGDEVAKWLDEVLIGNGLRLLRQCSDLSSRTSKNEVKSRLSLVNKAQYLMLNAESLRWLQGRVPYEDIECLAARFRCNFILDFKAPFVENDCKSFTIGTTTFTNEGQCTRCQMICINQMTGEKSVEPLKTISKEFGGKISFGVYLACTVEEEECIAIGMNASTR